MKLLHVLAFKYLQTTKMSLVVHLLNTQYPEGLPKYVQTL